MISPDVVLNKAADIIEERGHGHHYYMDNAGQVCAIGAIRLACGAPVELVVNPQEKDLKFRVDVFSADYDDNSAQRARTQLAKHLSIDEFSYSVVEWNDISDKETVVAAMREAAQKVKASAE